MKIISDFKDYYDFSCGYIDDSITYYRKKIKSEMEVGYIVNSIFPNSLDELLYLDFGMVIINNQIYPFARVERKNDFDKFSIFDKNNISKEKQKEILKLKNIDFIYDFEELMKYKNENGITFKNLVETSSYFLYSKYIKEVENFFNMKSIDDIKIKDSKYYRFNGNLIKEELTNNINKPIIVVKSFNLNELDDLKYKFEHPLYYKAGIYYNDCLKQIKFYKKLEGNILQQEISMFLNKEMSTEKEIKFTDKDLAKSKGFDKYSFRKIKNKG